MHPIWGVEDVVHLILLECIPASASAVAVTCRSLFLPAIHVLWANPPLLALANLISPTKDVEFSRPTLAKKIRTLIRKGHNAAKEGDQLGLKRFAFYASHVRILYIRSLITGEVEVLDRLLSALLRNSQHASLADLQLFPNLQTVHFEAYSVAFASKALEFANLPSVETVSVGLQSIMPETSIIYADVDGLKGPSLFADYLEPLSKLKRLDELELFGKFAYSKAEHGFLMGIANRFPSLSSLSTFALMLDSDFLEVLSDFRGVVQLDIRLPRLEHMKYSLPIPLPQLQELNMSYLDVDGLLCFMSLLSAPCLRTMSARSARCKAHGAGISAEHSSYRRLSETLASSFPHLQEFRISGLSYPEDAVYPWTFNLFAPLLSCRKMVKFSIRMTECLRVSDNELVSIAQSWPNIRYLAFCSPDDVVSSRSASATVVGLAMLSANCRALRSISLSVDLSPDLELSPSTITPNLSVTRLDVHDCPPCYVEQAAQILRLMFPKLKRFKFARRSYLMLGDEADAWDRLRVTCMKGIKRRLQC